MKKHLVQIFAVAFALCATSSAHASFLEGEALDSTAEVISWIVIIVAYRGEVARVSCDLKNKLTRRD